MNRYCTLFLTLCSIIALLGCDKKQDSAADGTAADAVKGASGLLDSAASQAGASFESIKSQLNDQVATLESKFQSIKTSAAKFNDEQLGGLMSQVDSKVDQIKSKIADVKSSEAAAAVTSEVSTWIGEAQSLLDQASQRVKELTAAQPAG